MDPPNVEANPPISLLVSSLLVRADEGPTLRAFGHAIVVLLDGKQSGGKFTAFLNMTPPGCGPGPSVRSVSFLKNITDSRLSKLGAGLAQVANYAWDLNGLQSRLPDIDSSAMTQKLTGGQPKCRLL